MATNENKCFTISQKSNQGRIKSKPSKPKTSPSSGKDSISKASVKRNNSKVTGKDHLESN
jgi:hypothetical protein